jgi:putative endopeptidase
MRTLVLAALAASALACACAASSRLAPSSPSAVTPSTTSSTALAPSLTLDQTGIVAGWMDPAADPCEDYFQYACGGFVKNTVIPPDRSSWSVGADMEKANEEFLHDVLEKAARAAKEPGSDPATQKIGDYYAACMDEDRIEKAGAQPLKPFLDQIAGVKDAKTLAGAITKLHALSVHPLFSLSSAQDFKDATRVVAWVDQDGLGLPDRDYYLKDDGNLKEVRTFYTGHVTRMLALLGLPPAEATTATADVLRIETKIAKLEQDKVERRDPYKVYHPVDRAGLTAIAKTFPWAEYLAALGLGDVRELVVSSPAYFTGMDALMHEEKPLAWRHYLAWQLAQVEAPRLSLAFQKEAFSLRQKITGQKELAPRWKRCVRAVDTELGELLAQPYVAAKFGGDSKPLAQALVQSIHDAMQAELGSLRWMDEATRAAALAKLAKITHKVGYPDTWRAYDFTVSRTDYAADAIAGDGFELHWQLGKVGKPVDKTEWGMTPPTVNAYYNPSLNEIVVPAGELQPPFFSRTFYAPVNIGDEGANTVGHELTHGFDDEGSQFDGEGNLRDWWTKDTKAKFEAATKCVQDQFGGYDAVPGVKLNGALTAGENIADIGGVKLGYAALMAWEKEHAGDRRTVAGFSDEKLFFLAYSQGWCSKETPELNEMLAHSNAHSPAKWRVNGPMADVPQFAQAYACKAGTTLNSGKVCSVW